jgi:hypothetical protein
MGTPPRRRNRPHDKAFRWVFSRPEHAIGALRELVGDPLADQLAWHTLRVEPGTYVEGSLRDLMSDLLFSLGFRDGNRRARIYLLWDHQRTPDRMMPLRLHTYGARALHDYTQTCDAIPGYVPTLIPLLVYQGPGQWPGPHTLSELSHLPGEDAPPVMVDLHMTVRSLDDGGLDHAGLTTLARTTFRLLRLAALGRLVLENAATIARWLEKVHDAHGYSDHRALLEYIDTAGKEPRMIDAIIEHSRDDVKDDALSTFDRFHAKGWTQGWEEGREAGWEEGREAGWEEGRERLLRQISARFGSAPGHVREKVLAATPQQIDDWSLRLLTATTLAELLDEP